ncbi:MAG: RNA pseudouridine synthase [Cyanobium sp. M30B3]|nr:MAG: RNA pseudouridine synthase [Cyanobium sp. M30B3]
MPAARNAGYTYRDRVGPETAGQAVSAFYAARYRHSGQAVWRQRLAAGEIERNGQRLRADGPLAAGDRLVWHRPPWQEGAVPVLPGPLFDDGDLLVFNKPSGLPVLPAGGWLEHTVLGQLERQRAAGELDTDAGPARPVHRLGRFTSGLLLCARRPATRAWLSALLRDSTRGHPNAIGAQSGSCRKTYRALLQPPLPGSPLLALAPAESLELSTPIGRRPHDHLGTIWAAACAADPSSPSLAARSTLTLLRCTQRSWLVELLIATGRPHQIRIHAAAAGAPLLGDPLYGPGGQANPQVLPGDGGYQLHAHRLRLPLEDGRLLELDAPLPAWAVA